MSYQLLRCPLAFTIKNKINSTGAALLKPRCLSSSFQLANSNLLARVRPNPARSSNTKLITLNNELFSSTSYIIRINKFTSSSRNHSKMPPIEASVGEYAEKVIKDNKIVVFSKTTCPWCVKAKELISSLTDKPVNAVMLDVIENGDEVKAYLFNKTGQNTVPNIFINGLWIGGYQNLVSLHNEGRLMPQLSDEVPEETAELRPLPNETIETFTDKLIKENKVMIFSKTTCPFCTKVKELFNSLNEQFVVLELDKINEGTAIRDYLYEKTGQKTVPNVFVKGSHIGGNDSTMVAHNSGRLAHLLNDEIVEDTTEYDYDLVVIGGGSGGLACSKQASTVGVKKVAVLDFVDPTPLGTTWGLGGTCVNVGCIPKKLMHQTALLGEALNDSKEFGWQTPEKIQHNWETMKNNIQDYIGSLNWGYRVQLRDKKVQYINGKGEFIDKHRLLVTQKNKKTREITAKNIVIAVGGRPKYPDIPGAKENSITSDDLFSLSYCPGKTLCVGASYVSLECAGFLKGLGLDVTVMVRSILLRGFDQQMANIVGDYMEKHHIKFIRSAVPTEIVKVKEPEAGKAPGEYIVKYKGENGEILEETYNTILFAVGREALTDNLGLDKVGVKTNPKNKKVITNFEQTNVDNIYAIGDVIEESSANDRAIELTPVAIQAGQLLAKRIFAGKDVKMDYFNVPTTVFTPLEYGAIGYSEEEAIAKFGEENIEVYHQNFWPLEWTVAKKPNDICYAKLICNKADKERIVGLHVAGPNAGEITQGYAIALRLRATKNDFNMTVGIHPTCSETFTTLNITKRSGADIAGAGC